MKLLIGGSPCTHWSIAQTKNRETEASGIGWELFLNYRIARDKYQPDFFLYENNKSMSPASWANISVRMGAPDSTVRNWHDKAILCLSEALDEVPMAEELLERASRARTY